MILENMENAARKLASDNACGEVSVKIESTIPAGFGHCEGKIAPRAANNLAGQWKTIRAAIPRQRNAALSMNESELRYAC